MSGIRHKPAAKSICSQRIVCTLDRRAPVKRLTIKKSLSMAWGSAAKDAKKARRSSPCKNRSRFSSENFLTPAVGLEPTKPISGALLNMARISAKSRLAA